MIEYKIYVNKREYKVPFKVYLCHMTNELKKVQPISFYDDFILNYEVKDRDFVRDYYQMYVDKSLKKTQADTVFSLCKGSLVALAYFCEYSLQTGRYSLIPGFGIDAFTSMILGSFVNYFNYSDKKFLSIPPLNIYHSLTYAIEDDLPCIRKIITREDIENTLKLLNVDFEFDYIEEEILKQCFILKKEDHYVWSNLAWVKWLYNIDITVIYRNNLQKKLGENKYNVNF